MSGDLPRLGIIEGYWGRPWSWADRTAVMRLLASHGYRFFLYAPKHDELLRRRWREEHPEPERIELVRFAEACHDAGVSFGVGLSPFEVHHAFDDAARAALRARVAQLDELGLDELAILFDDMRGDTPDLAARQAEIVHLVGSCTRATRVITCPTYYTDSNILDRLFGPRPARYLEDLGRLLDPAVEVFWTGEEVCSLAYTSGHLDDVAQRLRRRPMLWDNYPVNDGPFMSRRLHLRGFTGRPSSIAGSISGHAVNPALQPWLSTIPALTLVDSYRQGDGYQYMGSFAAAARLVLGDELGAVLGRDLLALQDLGLDHLGERAVKLRARWARFDHPAAREVVAWLDGEYAAADGFPS